MIARAQFCDFFAGKETPFAGGDAADFYGANAHADKAIHFVFADVVEHLPDLAF